jgi:excisionase family DNA binding protein
LSAKEEKLHPIPHAADRLGVSPYTIHDWIKYGFIESHKLNGRRLISDSEINRLIEQSRCPAISRPRVRIRIQQTEEAQEQGQSLATTIPACASGD